MRFCLQPGIREWDLIAKPSPNPHTVGRWGAAEASKTPLGRLRRVSPRQQLRAASDQYYLGKQISTMRLAQDWTEHGFRSRHVQ